MKHLVRKASCHTSALLVWLHLWQSFDPPLRRWLMLSPLVDIRKFIVHLAHTREDACSAAVDVRWTSRYPNTGTLSSASARMTPEYLSHKTARN